MNIKVLRAKTNLSQKAFGEELCVTAQTVQKYESGERNVPDTVKKLIRYQFAEFLPKEERLKSKISNDEKTVSFEEYAKVVDEREILKVDLEVARSVADGAKNLEKLVEMQEKTIKLLEDQIKIYKDRIAILEGKEPPSKTA